MYLFLNKFTWAYICLLAVEEPEFVTENPQISFSASDFITIYSLLLSRAM